MSGELVRSSDDLKARAAVCLSSYGVSSGLRANRHQLAGALFWAVGAHGRADKFNARVAKSVGASAYASALADFFSDAITHPSSFAAEHQRRVAAIVESMRIGGSFVTWDVVEEDHVGDCVFLDEGAYGVAVHRLPFSGRAARELCGRFSFDEFALWIDGALEPESPARSLARLERALDELDR